LSVSVALGGDVMLQRPLSGGRAGQRTSIAGVMEAADAAFVNVEVVLSERGQPADKMIRLRAQPALGAEVAGMGATVATVANNHAMDFGWDGLEDTIEALERAGVRAIGAGADDTEAWRPAVVETRGKRIGFLGIACTLPNGSAAADGRPGIAGIRVVSSLVMDPVTFGETPGMAPWVETEALADDAVHAVRAARAQVDALVVGIHWGVPIGWAAGFQGDLATYQQPLGRALIDAGADVVAGHHAHVLHGIELYRGRPIFYSLGNLVFHGLFDAGLPVAMTVPPYRTDTLSDDIGRETVIARVSLCGEDGVAADVIPVWLDRAGEPSLAGVRRRRTILDRLRDLSAELGTTLLAADGDGAARVAARSPQPG
jgi:poly-gamma-glutamate synthesis protein (capsule biosynthesis protein)